MLVAWALFFFAKDITQIYLALRLSGMSGGLLEAPVSSIIFKLLIHCVYLVDIFVLMCLSSQIVAIVHSFIRSFVYCDYIIHFYQ